MNYEVPNSIVTQAVDFWEVQGIPLLRKRKRGEQILILGVSLGQELPVLLSRKPDVDEDYGGPAIEAANLLPKKFPACNP